MNSNREIQNKRTCQQRKQPLSTFVDNSSTRTYHEPLCLPRLAYNYVIGRINATQLKRETRLTATDIALNTHIALDHNTVS